MDLNSIHISHRSGMQIDPDFDEATGQITGFNERFVEPGGGENIPQFNTEDIESSQTDNEEAFDPEVASEIFHKGAHTMYEAGKDDAGDILAFTSELVSQGASVEEQVEAIYNALSAKGLSDQQILELYYELND